MSECNGIGKCKLLREAGPLMWAITMLCVGFALGGILL